MGNMGSYIRDERTARGWTQAELAERADLSKSHLSQIERGQIALPNAEIRRRLASALGVRHVDLLIAAGEIRPDEVGAIEAERGRNPFLPNDPRHAIVEALLRGDPAITQVMTSVIELARKLRLDHGPLDAQDAGAA